MENWIEYLNNPLVLIGFVVLVAAGLVRLYITKPSQIQQVKGKENISIISGGNVKVSKNKK